MMYANAGDKPPSICHLPDRVLRQIAALIDTSVLCNWRTLATLIPEYTQMDVRAFAIEEQRVRELKMKRWSLSLTDPQ